MVMPTASELLGELVEKSRGPGWATGQMSAFWASEAAFSYGARQLGLVPVANRRGDPMVTELRPTTQEQANPSSLSARVGLGEQPLHTDGAHHRRPPDIVVLWSAEVSATPTRLWVAAGPAMHGVDQRGVFLVRSGAEAWLAPAFSDTGQLRFDPGCMTPADALARRLAAVLEAPPEDEVVKVQWDAPGKVLVLRNRRALHGRAAVADGDLDRHLSRVAYVKGER